MRTLLLTFVLGLALTAAPARAQAPARPDLSGTWEMDLARTHMWKKAVRPIHRVDRVEQRGDSLRWTWRAQEPKGRVDALMRFTTDGRWSHNMVAGHRCRSRAAWDGDTLVVNSHGRFLLISWHLQDRIHLAGDGGELHATRRFRMASMDEVERWVYRRVDGDVAGRAPIEDPARPGDDRGR